MAAWPSAGRAGIIGGAALMVAAVAWADAQIGLNISLGALYIIPISLFAALLPRRFVLGAAFLCAVLRGFFDSPGSELEAGLRFTFALIAYSSVGLLVTGIIEHRRLAVLNLERLEREQALRTEAEQQLQTLVESSPAGILTLNSQGVVIAANRAANDLFGLDPDQRMEGHNIETYLPVLRDALRLDFGSGPFRTAAQAQARRANGELFLANMWFSTYAGQGGTCLAAIVVDCSEEMREHEEQSLRQLSAGSRVMVSAVLHEVRNICSAISVVYSNLTESDRADAGSRLQGLENLVQVLGQITSLELQRKEADATELIRLRHVLDDLRIIIDPGWAEVDGTVHWDLPPHLPSVVADRHGLLQVFLNLAQNSLRSVQDCEQRELRIEAQTSDHRVTLRFHDTGPGVRDPGRLFQPFQSGQASTGLGLYISRALVRSYGGELRYCPDGPGACFEVELRIQRTGGTA